MAKARPFLQLFLARVRGQGLVSSEDFGQAFRNNTASHQKVLRCFDLIGHLLLSSHSGTPENYSANLSVYISYCWVPMEIRSGPYHQMYCTSIMKGHYSSVLHKVGAGCPGQQQSARNSLRAVLGVSGIACKQEQRSQASCPQILTELLSNCKEVEDFSLGDIHLESQDNHQNVSFIKHLQCYFCLFWDWMVQP